MLQAAKAVNHSPKAMELRVKHKIRFFRIHQGWKGREMCVSQEHIWHIIYMWHTQLHQFSISPEFPKPTLSSSSDFSMLTYNSVFWISFSLAVKLGRQYLPCRVVLSQQLNEIKRYTRCLALQHLISVSAFWDASPRGWSKL